MVPGADEKPQQQGEQEADDDHDPSSTFGAPAPPSNDSSTLPAARGERRAQRPSSGPSHARTCRHPRRTRPLLGERRGARSSSAPPGPGAIARGVEHRREASRRRASARRRPPPRRRSRRPAPRRRRRRGSGRRACGDRNARRAARRRRRAAHAAARGRCAGRAAAGGRPRAAVAPPCCAGACSTFPAMQRTCPARDAVSRLPAVRVEDDPPLDLAIERLTFGPDALAHHEGRVVFVPLAAPGDRVRARIVEQRARLPARRRSRTSSRAGPDRRRAALPGVRAVRRLPVAARRADGAAHARSAIVVAEQLARLGGLRDVDVRPTRAAPDAWAYRARITLVAEGRRLGFHRARSHALVEIDECAIADPVLVAHLGVARAWAAARAHRAAARDPRRRARTVSCWWRRCARAPTAATSPPPRTLLAATPPSAAPSSRGGAERIVVGDPTSASPSSTDLVLEVPADAFTQVNPAANLLLVATVLELGAFRGRRARARPLLRRRQFRAAARPPRRATCIGIERSRASRSRRRARTRATGSASAPDSRCDAVAAALARLPAAPLDARRARPAPRGCRGRRSALVVARAPPRIALRVVRSRHPRARRPDARGGRATGSGAVQPIDVFPQTYHVETVAEFVLT